MQKSLRTINIFCNLTIIVLDIVILALMLKKQSLDKMDNSDINK